MSRLRSRVVLAVGVSSLLASVAIAGTTAATTSTTEPESGAVEIVPSVEMLPPDEPYGGATLDEWGARYVQWSVSLPQNVNPAFSPAGGSCGNGQAGPVFFLPLMGGVQDSVDCVVPEGTAIYVPVVSVGCSSSALAPGFFGANEEELQACVDNLRSIVDDWSMQVAVNGQPVDIADYWTRTPMFTINVPVLSPYRDLSSGVGLMIAENNGFIIAPPPTGEYLISIDNETTGTSSLVTATVVAPQITHPTGTPAPPASEQPAATEPPPTT